GQRLEGSWERRGRQRGVRHREGARDKAWGVTGGEAERQPRRRQGTDQGPREDRMIPKGFPEEEPVGAEVTQGDQALEQEQGGLTVDAAPTDADALAIAAAIEAGVRRESEDEGDFLEADLHAIDMTRNDLGNMRDELMHQMETVGFLVLTNIPDYDEPKYLEACKALHSLPADMKRALYLQKDEPANQNTYRGYQPLKPNDKSHKEFLDMGLPMDMMSEEERQFPLYEPTPWPEGEEFQWIREIHEQTFRAWLDVALKIIGLLAEGLGKPNTFFDSWFQDGSLSTFRSIHYQPRSSGVVDSSELGPEALKLTTPEHADSGFLTFLSTFGYPGLQVYIDGEYKSVKPMSNTLVVNLGDTFARITNYRLKATYHRVLDIGRERYSSPLFLEPKYSARIPKGLLASGRQAADEDMPDDAPLFGDWTIRRFMASYVE
ncbi:2-oxoglutarate-Fe(II) type oxidoreductase (Endocrocin synthesis protein D), partial [Durusdinium trenchii]